MRMLLWHKPLSVCKSYSSARFRFSSSRGERAPFLLSPFFVTKRAARFRRVALKKLLSVFAEQPLCLPRHIYIIPHPFAKINTILSTFVHICPSLSNLRSKALHPQANFHRIRKLSVLCSVLFHAVPWDTSWYRFYDFQSCTAPQISHPPDFQVHPTVYKYIIPD